MHPNLSFEQAPPIWVPYRFFLTAPLFGVAAGLLLAWSGADALASRWTPAALALTHLMVAGYLLQAMCGALLQFIPVAAGGNVWRPRVVAGLVHPALLVGATLLVSGFLLGPSAGLAAGAGLMVAALTGYVAAAGIALLRAPAKGATIVTLRLAVVGLAVTYILGFALAEGLRGTWSLRLADVTHVHAAWGLGGWALLLLSGVSYYVVPMFQLTPPYPPWVGRILPWGMLAVLVLWAGWLLGGIEGWPWGLSLAGLALAATFAIVTLRLQRQRRRRVPDVTLSFFRVAMWSLLALAGTFALMTLVPDVAAAPQTPLWIGMLAVVGVFVSAINGMLYKIIPFLNWLHLQRLGGLTVLPPNMKDMIGDGAMRGQMRLHFAALASLLAAVVWPPLAPAAGMLFAASCGWLEWNLLAATRVYLSFKDRIRAADACHAP